MEFRDSEVWDGVVDLLMYVGSDNYTVPEILREGATWGISKRIPLQSIPDGVTPYFSELLGWHSYAIPFVTADGLTLNDLVEELVAKEMLSPEMCAENWDWTPDNLPLAAQDYVPDFMLAVTCAIQSNKELWSELGAKYKLQWQGGVIFRTIIGPIEYVCKKGEDGLPDDVAGDPRYKAVKVRHYVDDNGEVIGGTEHPEYVEDDNV